MFAHFFLYLRLIFNKFPCLCETIKFICRCSTYINEKENVPDSQGDIDCKINVKRDGKSHNRIVHVVTRINGRSSYKRTSWKSVSVSEIHDDKKYYA